jgi:hypothetical protein
MFVKEFLNQFQDIRPPRNWMIGELVLPLVLCGLRSKTVATDTAGRGNTECDPESRRNSRLSFP